MNPAVRQLLLARRGGNHPVLSLFSRRERGAWYDPSDLSSLTQDATGGTRVTAFNDPVGRMRDKSGNGNDATQSTAGSRPAVDATGLVCAGAKAMVTPAFLDSSFNTACTIFAVVKAGTPHTDLRLIVASATPNFWIGVNGATQTMDFTSHLAGGSGGVVESTGILAFSVGLNRYRMGMARWWNQNSSSPKSGSASVSQKTSGVSGGMGFAGDALTIGGLSSSSFQWPGSVGEFICLNREVSLSEYKQVLRYLTDKWTLYDKNLIVCSGNSLTSGQGSTGGATQLLDAAGTNYPSRLLNARSATWDVRTDAYPGRTLSQMVNESPELSDLMTVSPTKRKVAMVWEVTNQLATEQNAASTLSLLQAYCVQRRNEGFSVLVGTCIARGGALYAGFEADRLSINASILANFAGYADGVVDFAALTELQDVNNATYFNADKIHLTDAGYQVAANAVDAKLTALGW